MTGLPSRREPASEREVDDALDPQYDDAYYEHIARTIGPEQAAWARLPRHEREAELRQMHASANTPDDIAIWPPELDGGVHPR